MSRRSLMPAPIDNKNILEGFANDIVNEFDDGSVERQTFWKHDCLYLIDYEFGTHWGTIKCLYGEPTMKDVRELKADLAKFLNVDNGCNQSCCKLTADGKDILFAFYWRVK